MQEIVMKGDPRQGLRSESGDGGPVYSSTQVVGPYRCCLGTYIQPRDDGRNGLSLSTWLERGEGLRLTVKMRSCWLLLGCIHDMRDTALMSTSCQGCSTWGIQVNMGRLLNLRHQDTLLRCSDIVVTFKCELAGSQSVPSIRYRTAAGRLDGSRRAFFLGL